MTTLYNREQPEAGPSSRPLVIGSTDRVQHRRAAYPKKAKRQEGQTSSSINSLASSFTSASSSSESLSSTGSSTSTTYTDLFPTSGLPSSSINSTSGTESASSWTASNISSIISTSTTPSSTISRPWRTSTRSTSYAPSETPYVAGVILPLTLGGDDDDQAVYSVPMVFGHDDYSSKRRKRDPGVWQGGAPQTVNLQVDLGSSDMWAASSTCSTSDCKSAPALFNTSESLASGFDMEFQYQSGTASGEVYWEQVLLGSFGIGYQAFLAADRVSNEDLGGGNFTGVLGLALPANSIILSRIAGSTSGNPDGATFLDNLFGSGASAPTQRLFSLSLERREDVRTSSTLGIGAISEAYCPSSSCKPRYLPIIPQPSLGLTGYLHWRLPLQGISATTWADQQSGAGPTSTNITLGASRVDGSRSTPLAVLDSGGVAILAGYKPWADAIYSAFNVTASADGYYRMPCTKQIALTLTFGGQDFPIHPLDMTWPDPADPSMQTCIGAIQYSSSLGSSGDFILGSAFMKNVYSIFQYPDNTGRVTWQPTVGMVSLTNASVASEDFYAVRVQGQSLSEVSSNHETGVGPSNPTATDTSYQGNSGTGGGATGLSSAVIAGITIGSILVFAAAVFCAWWFWLRRRFSKNGQMEFSDGPGEGSAAIISSTRNRKHDAAQRQKSMVEGYSDYEDSWISTTEGGESIRLGYMPEVVEEDDPHNATGAISTRGSSMREPSPRRKSDVGVEELDEDESRDTINPFDSPTAVPLTARRGSSTSRLSLAGDNETPKKPKPYGYPGADWSMAGPFPSPARTSMVRPDTSPMYDIRSSDYFAVDSVTPSTREGGRRTTSISSMRDSSAGARGRSPGRLLGSVLAEEAVEDVGMTESSKR